MSRTTNEIDWSSPTAECWSRGLDYADYVIFTNKAFPSDAIVSETEYKTEVSYLDNHLHLELNTWQPDFNMLLDCLIIV